LGIDPGSLVTGYGIIDARNNTCEIVEYGCIRTNSKSPLPQRLSRIYHGLCLLIKNKEISEVGVEEAFYAKNVRTTLMLGHARGVILLAAENEKARISEYSPREIKKSVTGNGAASKEQVQYMVERILKAKEPILPSDASDALAVALCHINRLSHIKP
jgi:crossover junction endodeoxyribonuclease RuvC